MFDWIKSFLEGIFGDFWANLMGWAMKLLVGPVAFYLFGPLFKLSGYVAGQILAQIKPYLSDVGVELTGITAWFVSILRIQECLSMFMTFMVLGFTISMIKKFI